MFQRVPGILKASLVTMLAQSAVYFALLAYVHWSWNAAEEIEKFMVCAMGAMISFLSYDYFTGEHEDASLPGVFWIPLVTALFALIGFAYDDFNDTSLYTGIIVLFLFSCGIAIHAARAGAKRDPQYGALARFASMLPHVVGLFFSLSRVLLDPILREPQHAKT